MENLEKLADLFKALSDPTRLRIVKHLCQHEGTRCVNALTRQLSISQSAVSQHLRTLKQSGIVYGERMGNFVHYRINDSYFEVLRKKLLEVEGRDFLVVSGSGLFSFGPGFWDQQSRITELEEKLVDLRQKTEEIEFMIDQLKDEG